MSLLRHCLTAITLLGVLVVAAPATAGAAAPDDPAAQWLPRSDGAAWVYAWSNSEFSPTPRREQYRVTARTDRSFRVNWDEIDLRPYEIASAGFADFTQTDAGLVNTNYESTQAPPQFPLLCATAVQCGNSLSSSLFLMFWGTRSPVIAEPLVKGTQWTAVGGADNDVASVNRYLGHERLTVPAFPAGIDTAKVESEITQAGALGDPFGSGLRTVWWAYGVGPVRIVFKHSGGETSTSELQSTTLAPLALPHDDNALPFTNASRATFRWRNTRHMRAWSRQRFAVADVLNNTARVDVTSLSGPLDVSGSYLYVSRLSGVRNLSATTRQTSSSADFPRLGPRGSGDSRNRFRTPYDLMNYGFNPIIPAYAKKGDAWRSSRDTRDWAEYGVVGISTVLGRRSVRTPAGRFKRTIAVRSTLRQPGFRFGSGTRTSWFQPGRGLVKLVFRHDDGSVTQVERIR